LKRNLLCILMLTVSLLVASGCSTDIKDIEKLSYASAIGVDYKDGKYHGYIQFIDFQSVAKTSDGMKTPSRVWVGEGVGDTFEEAFFNLYQTAQERIYWGHLTSIVISESAFKKGIKDFYDSVVRYYEFRLTPWVYGTREPIEDILSAGGFFGQSPLSTILHEPKGIYSQSSVITPIKLHRLIGQINEPGFTTCIPTLSLNKKQWSEKNKTEPKLMMDGAIFLKNDKFRSYIPIKELDGLRWLQEGTVRAGVPVPSTKKPAVQIVVDKPNTKLSLDKSSGDPRYNIDIKATAYMVNRTNNSLLELQQLTEKSSEVIEEEIRSTLKTGLEKKTDIYNFEHDMYRNHYEQWRSISPDDTSLLKKNVIRNVRIHLNIKHSSKEKNSTIHRGE
jgi:spore germination protein KC